MDYYDSKNWQLDAGSTFDRDTAMKAREYLDHTGYLVGLHSHFCGGRAASPVAFDDSDEFESYMSGEVRPGDILRLWPVPESDPTFSGKAPNDDGEVPIKGAY